MLIYRLHVDGRKRFYEIYFYNIDNYYKIYLTTQRGKSRELLQIAMDFKMCNSHLKHLENGKEAVILFITQENSIRETLQRIWTFYNGDSDDFKSYSTKDALEKLNKKGFTNGPALDVRYRKTKSITTADVDDMIEKIEMDGERKVIAVIHDYLKRIRSTQKGLSTYDELGEICDEWVSIAKSRNIPIITAMQFNREAMKIVEEATAKKKNDILKNVGTSSIGESVKIVDNSDVIYSILDQPDPVTGKLMLVYKLLKFRGRKINTELSYFCHPFEDDNGIRLKNDLKLAKSLSKTNIGDGLEDKSPSEVRNKRGGRINKQKKKILDDD